VKWIPILMLTVLIVPQAATAQHAERYRGPIIDMHLHAHTVASYGPEPIPICTADEPVVYLGLDPSRPMTLDRVAAPCTRPVWSSATDEDLLREPHRPCQRRPRRREGRVPGAHP
jgi:hypothetical protein